MGTWANFVGINWFQSLFRSLSVWEGVGIQVGSGRLGRKEKGENTAIDSSQSWHKPQHTVGTMFYIYCAHSRHCTLPTCTVHRGDTIHTRCTQWALYSICTMHTVGAIPYMHHTLPSTHCAHRRRCTLPTCTVYRGDTVPYIYSGHCTLYVLCT